MFADAREFQELRSCKQGDGSCAIAHLMASLPTAQGFNHTDYPTQYFDHFADSGNVNQPAADVGNTLHFDDMPNFNPP